MRSLSWGQHILSQGSSVDGLHPYDFNKGALPKFRRLWACLELIISMSSTVLLILTNTPNIIHFGGHTLSELRIAPVPIHPHCSNQPFVESFPQTFGVACRLGL